MIKGMKPHLNHAGSAFFVVIIFSFNVRANRFRCNGSLCLDATAYALLEIIAVLLDN